MEHRAWPLGLALIASTGGAVALPACVDPIDEHTSAVGEVVRDCVVPEPAGVAGWGAPASLEYPDHSLWLWDQVDLAGGGSVAGAAAVVADAAGACSQGPAFVTDAGGRPVSLLALTAGEEAANAARTDGKRLALLPRGGFVHDGTGYLFYVEALLGPGFFDAQELGTGLCVLVPGATSCERVLAGGDPILWPGTTRMLDRGGLVVGDRAIVAGCRKVAAFVTPCTVSGAPIDRVRDPAAWQVWNAFDGWIDDATNATELMDTQGALTLSAYGGGYLATTLDLFENRVDVRRSDKATDGYGHPIDLFDTVPDSFFPAGGREHSGLRHGDARTLHVSYVTDGAAAPGLHLVSFRFYGDPE
ncbi:MAG TPA: hypothetical protein VHE35_27480 [Kofleriaceae bacterium]|nr:hypothetical protein [Kofleriaceae bacterium]